jgi:hypothetical protein
VHGDFADESLNSVAGFRGRAALVPGGSLLFP